MKKILGLSVIALLISIFLPLNVNATEIFASSKMSMVETTEGGKTFSISNGNGNTMLYLGVNVTEGTFKNYTAHIELENSNFTFSGLSSDYKPTTGWTGTVTKSATGNGIDVDLTNSTGYPAGTRKIVASITLTVADSTPSTDTCKITLGKTEEPENPKCQIVDDTYYDANGNEVSEEAYNAACTTAENPQTGSFLPYTLIIVGIALAGGLYYITKKNNKMYQV